MTSLYAVLDAIRQADRPMSLNQLAQELNIERSALEGMLDFWVRKGKLCIIGPMDGTVCSITGCSTCSAVGPMSCPLVVHDPIRYELATPPHE